MTVGICPSDIPVLLLYNLDPKWSTREQAEALDATFSNHPYSGNQ